jgi:glycine cleavage system aminomethyltransferase T
MDLTDRVRAVRTSVALSRLDHVAYVRIRGDEAVDAVDGIFPRELYLRDGQLSQGVLLHEDGTIFADCYLGSDGDDFFLFAEGPAEEDLVHHARMHSADVEDVEVEGMGSTHGVIGLDGPYAWELLARLVGPEVIGLPYLTFFHFDGTLCCRVGKTGEYGYALAAPHDALEDLWTRLLDLGASFDVGRADLEVLDLCAMESWFFNIRGEGRHPVTPLELQLQWRISRRKSYLGSEALARRRQEGIRRRLTCLEGPTAMASGDAVSHDGEAVGAVIHAGPFTLREGWVALSLMDLEYAFPGIPDLRVGDREVEARSVTPPVVNNRSLYVNPQVHSYASRNEDDFPLIVPE